MLYLIIMLIIDQDYLLTRVLITPTLWYFCMWRMCHQSFLKASCDTSSVWWKGISARGDMQSLGEDVNITVFRTPRNAYFSGAIGIIGRNE